MKADWDMIQNLAQLEIDKILSELPEPLRAQAEKIPIILQKTPDHHLQSEGIEVEALGLFTGAEFTDEGTTVLPPQIMMFLENLWSFSGGDEQIYRSEVRTTFLHELGHFFGLDEGDLMERGLE